MRKVFKLGDFELYWLEGGVFEIDGGSMFGVVPRVLWQKKCPATDDNYVTLADSAILVRTGHENILIETGLGNKLTEKQKKIFRLRREWCIPDELLELGMTREDIDHVILTHCDFDHAAGITMMNGSGEVELTFPRATYYMQRMEWEDVCSPNRRSASSYWPVNFKGLVEGKNLFLVDGEHEVASGIHVERTGGHTRGHQVVRLSSNGRRALHMGDLLPTTAYSNPLWITAYDNFPLDSVAVKEKLLKEVVDENMWLIFYHDPDILACRFDEKGEVIDAFRS